jgi:hypothetical protein
MPYVKRRSFIQPSAIGLLTVLGLIWFAVQFQSFPALVGAVCIAFLYVLHRRACARDALFFWVTEALEQQIAALIRTRAQLVRLDPHGKPQHEKWVSEIKFFISKHIQPFLDPKERTALQRNFDSIVEMIEVRVETAMGDPLAFQTYSDDMTPAESEMFRASRNAGVTLQSRDQALLRSVPVVPGN